VFKLNITRYYQKTKNGFEPFNYQKEVAETILNGENVILQAPTGAGKTLAAIMPFIIAKEEDIEFPKKLIYSTPRRTLVNSLFEDISKELNEGDFSSCFNITIQTGERQEDRFFNGDIIFTTFDQSLSSALSIPISLSNRLGNINVGAILSSYLVFDEFHLFDLDGSYTTTILLLEKLQGKVPFCIMTATLSDEKTEFLSKKLNARIIKADSGRLLADIITQKGKERKLYVCDNKSINGEEVLKLHNNIQGMNGDNSKKSIVMCNRVDNAQQIYRDILTHLETDDTDVILIHSRFLEKDRKEKEDKIKYLFSKNNKESNIILVSTQVIEVGIDITSHIMHTEISAIDSFLQRIGRCARYQNEKGSIYIYQPLNEGEKRYLPYNEEATIKTMEVLKELDGQILNSHISQEVINRIYSKETDIDRKDNEKVGTNTGDFLVESWKLPDKKNFKDLVRNVIGCNIIISEWIPGKTSPYNYQSLGISPWSLRSKVKEIAKDTDDWLVKEVIELNKEDKTEYTYKQIDANDIYPGSLYILNPQYFSYDQEIGLTFNEKSKYMFERLSYEKREPELDRDYQEESYLQHIIAIKKEIDVIKKELQYGIELIKREFSLSAEDFDNIIEFVIWSHDLGKLSKDWQLAHQKEECEFIAHAKRIKQPPGHAAESFWIVYDLLDLFIKEFIKKDDYIFEVIGKAIVSHHSPVVKETGPFILSKKTREYLSSINKEFFSYEQTADFINTNIKELILLQKVRDSISDELRLNDIKYFFFYFILVRILRLADQRATQKLNEEGVS